MLICLKCVIEEQMRKDFIGPEEAEYKKLQRQNDLSWILKEVEDWNPVRKVFRYRKSMNTSTERTKGSCLSGTMTKPL